MIYEQLIQFEEIEKGWSGDKKYRITTSDGSIYLLRISPGERRERKQREFIQMQQVAQLGIPMCLPIEWGECTEGIYSIQSWISGTDAEPLIPTLQ